MKKLLVAIALAIMSTPSFAQTAGQSVMGFLLLPGNSYGGYTCPSTNVGPCFVQYGSSLPISGSGGTISVVVAPLTSTNLSGTVTTTNTFQSIQTSTAGRKGCTIQNQSSTDPMWVFFGPIGSATKATAFQLDATHGEAISCAVGGLGVLTDQVSITGTSTDAYVANFQ